MSKAQRSGSKLLGLGHTLKSPGLCFLSLREPKELAAYVSCAKTRSRPTVVVGA